MEIPIQPLHGNDRDGADVSSVPEAVESTDFHREDPCAGILMNMAESCKAMESYKEALPLISEMQSIIINFNVSDPKLRGLVAEVKQHFTDKNKPQPTYQNCTIMTGEKNVSGETVNEHNTSVGTNYGTADGNLQHQDVTMGTPTIGHQLTDKQPQHPQLE